MRKSNREYVVTVTPIVILKYASENRKRIHIKSTKYLQENNATNYERNLKTIS